MPLPWESGGRVGASLPHINTVPPLCGWHNTVAIVSTGVVFRLLLSLVLLVCLLSSSCLIVPSCGSLLCLTPVVPCFVLVVCVCRVWRSPGGSFSSRRGRGGHSACCSALPGFARVAFSCLATPRGLCFALCFACPRSVLLRVQSLLIFAPHAI